MRSQSVRGSHTVSHSLHSTPYYTLHPGLITRSHASGTGPKHGESKTARQLTTSWATRPSWRYVQDSCNAFVKTWHIWKWSSTSRRNESAVGRDEPWSFSCTSTRHAAKHGASS
ncbi:uncharacterized protein [Cherax quadricarinatus]|uniref:uncharacterized protein isoform X2 n=1 Tax=Cherax quadricarinatus TaxID=27406 RepID=UPI00387E2A62